MKQKLLKTMLLLCALVAGSTSVWADPTVLFHETFGNNTGSARAWNDSYSVKSGVSAVYSGITGYTVSNAKQGKNTTGSTQSGLNQSTKGTDAYIVIGPLNVADYESLAVTYQWNAGSIKETYTTKLEYATSSGGSYTEVSGTGTGATSFVECSYSLPAAAQVSTLYLKITWNTSNTQGIIDEVELTGTSAGGGGGSDPSISADDVEINYDDTAGGIIYEIDNYDEDEFVSVVATTEADWISDFTYDRVDETGEVDFTTTTNTGVVERSATVTLTYTYDTDKTVTKDVTVTQNPNPDLGTSTLPYTIAQAKAKIDASGTTAGKYVHGIISQIDSYSSNTITYWISDDGTTTNQFEVYKGKGKDNANFTAITDLELGDIVTVYGEITLYNKTTYEFSSGNYIKSLVRKEASDLTITSSTPVALEITSAVPSPTSTITWTTSSTGAMSFESNNEGVVTVTSAGVITAVGAGSTTITISQAADEDYKASGNKTVTVNVTDNRSACATGIDLTSAKTILKGGSGALAATSTAADGFTGSITYSYVSDDTDIFSITDGNYSGAGVGATTVTITATPTGGNAANYKPASQEVAVTVNGTNSISLDPTSKTVAFSASTFDIAATVPTEEYDGTVTAESNNTSVATVSVDGTTVTVTPVAVGTARITVTAGTGTYYLATAQANCDVTITAPAGSTTAPSSEVTYTFDFSDNTDKTGWGFPTDYTTGENTYTRDGKTITLNTPDDSNGYKFNTSVILFGKEGATLTLPAFDKPVTKISTTGVSGASGKVTQNIYVGSTAVSTETTSAKDDHEYEIDENYQDAGTIYTLKVTNGNNTQLSDLTVHMYQAPTATVGLNASGYATYCSVNPIDFSSTTGYTAWRVNDIAADGTITFKKITEKIKGGQGVLLYDKDASGVKNVTVTFADGSVEFDNEDGDDENNNYLVGTTAPTNVAAGAVYGLSGNKFVKSSAAGNIPAGKAYILASSIPSSVKAFTLVFDDEATGITETRTATREEVEAIFNLAGQRINKMQKGINIVNGKKVLK